MAAVLLVSGAATAQAPVPEIELRPGLVITESVRVVSRTYRFDDPPVSLDSAVITIRGDDIVVDFAGATLVGLEPAADPALARGVAIQIDGGENVRLSNATVRGYRFAVLARGTRNLTLDHNDFSYTWKPRLFSLVEHESLVDWLSYHHNDEGEWLRFGAAVYLDSVTGGTIRANRAVQGMNGLLVTDSDSLLITDNAFSFNSGLGVGLYRSSDNTITHNRIEYDVRGYSHGFYQRGQDSAGLLLYAQSRRNVVAYNSVTHGGDGLFLWAGQHTMDTGEGGANDNLFFGNDFSYAPTNAMEATFSRNTFVANRAAGSRYGLWGGYSWESVVVGNCFGGNQYGVAIEHGQDNVIAWNRFEGDSTAIQLWAREREPTDWGYPQHRDTRSRDHRLERNVAVGNRVGIRGTRTSGLSAVGNAWVNVDSLYAFADTADVTLTGDVMLATAPPRTGRVGEACGPVPPRFAALAPPDSLGRGVPTSPLARRDRSAIVVDEWGPYDWRSPKLWPADSTRALPLPLAVLGPEGTWRVVEERGLRTISQRTGRAGDTISVIPEYRPGADWALLLEYVGEATISPRGVERPAGTPYRFGYSRFEPAVEWTVRFFVWDSLTDPTDHADAFAALLDSAPVMTRIAPRLDYQWYRPPIPNLPVERWTLSATGAVDLQPGEYTLRTISDDAVRVWVDDELVIDAWTPHESRVDSTPIAGGSHELRVWYYQVDGWTELRLEILRGNP